MPFFKKIKSCSGQHTVEIIVLITLIMAGILIMGPYVIRSWNANLKGWEDSAVDSVEDPFLDAPGFSMPGCDPLDWEVVGCNLGRFQVCTGETLSCSPVEMLSIREFDPDGCQCTFPGTPPDNARCTVDPCCCTTPVPTGACGINATFINSEPSCNVQMTPKYPDGTCPDGMMESWVLCGFDPDPAGRRYGCMPDAACVFECTGVPATGPGFLGLCPGDNTRLPSDVPYTYTDNCNNGTSPTRKCEVLCDNSAGYYSQ